ncbi:MAG TPA: acyl-CoA thioesterase [Steroidobacteraceae bacterium]|nr:acyl-CoA thioesterase [Steroidobacteraceae bacterium]
MSHSPNTEQPPAHVFVNRREVRIEWGDCDPAQIVFFPRYFAFFDASTAYLFEAAGLPKPEMIRTYDIIGIPLVDVSAKFFIPSRFGDRVLIESHVSEWRRSSFRIVHRLLKDDQVAVIAQEVRVWAGRDPERPEGIKARPIPQEVIGKFGRNRPR